MRPCPVLVAWLLAACGKNGPLLTNNTTPVTGAFISDVANTDGTRTTNYTGTLADAFSTIASVGSSGCGFEQPLEAMRRALDNHPSNAGFLRADAALAVIALQDEDDCSFTHSTLLTTDTSVLGPLQSFRCTRFGVTCDDGGATPDEMNAFGTKSQCHSSDASDYLTPRAARSRACALRTSVLRCSTSRTRSAACSATAVSPVISRCPLTARSAMTRRPERARFCRVLPP